MGRDQCSLVLDHLAIGLHDHLVEMPSPVTKPAHAENALTTNVPASSGPNLFHHSRTVSLQMSIPRSWSRSSTLRSESGYRTYIMTTRRMTSGDELKCRNGLRGFARDLQLMPARNQQPAHCATLV